MITNFHSNEPGEFSTEKVKSIIYTIITAIIIILLLSVAAFAEETICYTTLIVKVVISKGGDYKTTFVKDSEYMDILISCNEHLTRIKLCIQNKYLNGEEAYTICEYGPYSKFYVTSE